MKSLASIFLIAFFLPWMVHSEEAEPLSETQWLGVPASKWVDKLKSSYPEDRMSALKMLRLHPKECERVLMKLVDTFGDSQDDVRAKVIDTLKVVSINTEVLTKLIRKIDYNQSASTFALEDYLFSLGRNALPALVNSLKEDSKDVELFSARALKRIDLICDEARPILLEIADHNDKRLRESALAAFVAVSTSAEACDTLVERLRTEKDASRQSEYISLLAGMQKSGENSLSALIQVWKKTSDTDVRRHAARALARIGGTTDEDRAKLESKLRDTPELSKEVFSIEKD